MALTGAGGLSVTYSGATNASITNSGALTCASTTSSGTITSNGNTVLTTASVRFTYGLNYVSANTTSISGPASIPNWSFSYAGRGGSLLINCSVTGYVSAGGTLHSVSLYRAGTQVAKQSLSKQFNPYGYASNCVY